MDTETIGPITFSQLWKIPFFVYLLFFVMTKKRENKPSFIKISYARAGKNLFNTGMVSNPFAEVLSFVRYMMFPLMFEYIIIKFGDLKKINNILYGFSEFVVISGIPFILGIMESKVDKEGYIEFDNYVGVFQNPHGASITTSIAVLILLSKHRALKKTIYKTFNILLIILGLYLLYKTYVRTGYLMFVVGVFIMFLPKKITFEKIFSWIIIIVLVCFLFYFLLETQEEFYNRIFNIRNGERADVGSGRFGFWIATYNHWENGNIFELLFGKGIISLKEYLDQTLGMYIPAHSEFFNQLAFNGVIGVFILLLFLINLFRFIRANKNKFSYKLALAIFYLYLSLMLTQGGIWFQAEVLMALLFSKLYMENDQRKVKL